MNQISKPDFDVGIIGGGPAGASMAAYLAKAGLNCVVFERELFPRPHVGESLVPAVNRVFQEIDFLDKMEEAKFPHKYGAGWVLVKGSENGKGRAMSSRGDIRFDEREMAGPPQGYTYHVDRAKFDLMLLQHAQQLGATVHEGVRVQHVEFSDDDYPRLVYSIGRKKVKSKVRLVVDASGRRTMLGHQLKLRIKDPVFNQFAIHTWFDGYERGNSEEGDYIFLYFLPIIKTWVWQIPITESITSFGVVTPKKYFANQKESREKFFWDCIQTQPDIFEKLKQAEQLYPFKAGGDYSYSMKQLSGDGFVLLGDAARFVDPIFSSGVSVALNSARLASQNVIQAFEQSDLNGHGIFKREHFREYETILGRGMNNWYEFISLYYRLNILFTTFLRDPRYRLHMLKLIQGYVYDEIPEVLQKMRKVVNAVEQNPDHLWHNQLVDLTA